MNRDNYPILTDSRNFTLFLRDYVYTDTNMITILKSKLESSFDLFQIIYREDVKQFELRIKKTNMKKIPNYSHDCRFYYGTIDRAMYDFLAEPEVRSYINNKIQETKNINPEVSSSVVRTYNDILIHNMDISSLYLYTLTPIPDSYILVIL